MGDRGILATRTAATAEQGFARRDHPPGTVATSVSQRRPIPSPGDCPDPSSRNQSPEIPQKSECGLAFWQGLEETPGWPRSRHLQPHGARRTGLLEGNWGRAMAEPQRHSVEQRGMVGRRSSNTKYQDPWWGGDPATQNFRCAMAITKFAAVQQP